MARLLGKFVLAVFVTAASGAAWAQVQGFRQCELGYRNSIFTPSEWPDRSLEQLAQGDLGIVDPRFDHYYLFIAYRRIAGKSLTAQDVERLRAFDPCWREGSRQGSAPDGQLFTVMGAARNEWAAARQAPGLPLEPKPKMSTRSVMGYYEDQVPNCNADAFRTAARTLRARLRSYAGTPWLPDWVEAQDRVMQLCFDASAALPAPAPAGAPDWLRADRAYQRAAGEFYAGRYEDAARSFTAIAQDTGSPWQPWGLYLAARSRIRQAGAAPDESQGTAHHREARALLDTALAKERDAGMRHDLARMLQRVRLQLEPEQVFAEIDARLGAATLSPDVGQDVRDFEPRRAAEAKFDPRDPGFAAWLHALRKGTIAVDADVASASPLARLAWLVSAKPGDSIVPDLLHWAASVPKDAPSYRTVQFHRIRLLSERAEAGRLARQMLALPRQALDAQDRNRFKVLALPMAASPTELAAWAYREPIDHPEVHDLLRYAAVPAVDEDGAAILNRAMPLDRLYTLYRSAATPRPLRDQLLGVVWTRSLVLDRPDLLHALQPDMQKAFPRAGGMLRRVAAASERTEYRQLASLFLVQHPGIVGSLPMEISYADPGDPTVLALPNMHRRLLQDGSRSNWWCSLPAGRYWYQEPPPTPPASPPFLAAGERRRWKAEYAQLAAQPNGTEYLAPAILAWAKAHPRDPELPPALRMIVRSARGGCVTPQSRWMGHEAFRHLHRYFPGSEAARQTRTWG